MALRLFAWLYVIMCVCLSVHASVSPFSTVISPECVNVFQ